MYESSRFYVPDLPLDPPPEPDAVLVFFCSDCGNEIYEGEEYFEFDGDIYCEECFSENAVKLLIEKCGAVKKEAELEEPDYDDIGD